ncbi:MAG: branched-chain amino acid aminotransferase [Bacteroidetes bacterium]|nr:branched-chain amino acid aminotransferase [Bacteroidota bacterium]
MEVNTNFEIRIRKSEVSRIDSLDFNNIPFGKVFSDHMFSADYYDGEWRDCEILPFSKISISPSMTALHYGQAIFEGMKAFKDMEGNPQLFRPEQNFTRFNNSAHRMAMPELPEEIFISAIKEIVSLDRDWIPSQPNCALYIRPFMFATDEFIGIKPSDNFKFMIFTCPVGIYYPKPVKILVSEQYVRAFPGGAGFAKAAGNYGATLLPIKEARTDGYDQILWMEGGKFKFIQESGTMNAFFMIDDVLITPELDGTILDGVTRNSVIQLMKDKGVTVEERPISIDEVVDAYHTRKLQDAFGTGTAVTIAHFESIGYKGEEIMLPHCHRFLSRNQVQ